MRLLECSTVSQLSLTKDLVGDDIPEYAILSHTWGADSEEVTFKDLMDGTGRNKTGYDKIWFCGEQARRDGLRYFWVDSCCIDKSSSAELSEAIISMFRWYHNAVKCYVYLADVSRSALDANDESTQIFWESTFRKSKWFTRGWTLQELLAPAFVDFYSKGWEHLGDRRSLERHIHEATGIPIKALQGGLLSSFSIEERLLWAKDRKTTREEDKAYSLLGIFNIQMPPLYGEGRENAFRRLWKEIDTPSKGPENDLLRHLPFAVEAPFNSYKRQHEPTCHPDTRVDLLQEMYNWSDGHDVRCIFWLNGLAGTGKSTIARTIARRYSERGHLGASFFFSRGIQDVSHAGRFFTSLAVQLSNQVPSLRHHISDAISKNKDIASQSLGDQWRQLILRPLSKPSSCDGQLCCVLVIDALDECDNEDHIRTILHLLAEARSLTTVRLRIFLTSRPEISIRHGIYAIPQAEHQDFVLHGIEPTIINHDIFLFFEYNLGTIRQEYSLGADWPGEVVVRQLVIYACGLFIWAATACRFIREGRRFARKRLNTILKGSSSALTAPEKHLNEIYLAVLKHSISPDYLDEEKEEAYDMLKYTLGSIVVLLSPLSSSSLSRLLQLSKEDVDSTFNDLHAILDIPNDPTCPLRLHHPSFRDFLLNKDRCGDFWVDEKEVHQILATSCIQLMSQTLKKDICEMHAPGSQASQVENSRIEKCLPPEVQYACLYWVQHLKKGGSQVRDGEKAHQFLQAHLLHWLEALGWMGKTSDGIQAILSLEAYISINESPNLYALMYDAKRFALYNRYVIEKAPLQLYCSALVFAPGNSIIRRKFKDHIPDWIQLKSKVQANWNAALQTLEGHSDYVSSVAFSMDGKQVVSGSRDHTVRLWDATTGALLQTLEGHSDRVKSVAFSPDGKQVVSGSEDKTVRLWEAATGASLQTLEGHSSYVSSVAFSPDGKQVMSGSWDHTVRLWDAATGALLQTLEGHSDRVKSVAFSLDRKQVVSSSGDKTVRLWDAATGALLQTLKGHSGSVKSVAFSPDSKQVVSSSYDQTVQLWDAATGASLQTLEGHSSSVSSVAFSPNGEQVVSGSRDHTVRLWDTATGALLQTLKGHSSYVTSVAFSPDSKQVVSSSWDKTVRLWDTAIGASLQTLKGHSGLVNLIAFSLDSKQVVSESQDQVVQLWDTATRASLQRLNSYLDQVSSVAFSLDGKQVVSGSEDYTVQLWDTATGTLLQRLKGHFDRVSCVAFSPDSKQVVSGSFDKTVRLWDTTTRALLQTLKGHSYYVNSIAFSPDGKQVVSGSDDGTVRLWDAATGLSLQTLSHFDRVSSVAFSPDGKQVVSGSYDNIVQLWDAATGASLQTLKAHSSLVKSVAFSPDGKLLPVLQVFNHWVVEGDTNILWLPPDYREICLAIWNGNLAIEHLSGKISLFHFAKGSKLII